MAEQRPRWPTNDEIMANSERGFIDDVFDAVPPYDLEEREIRGEPEPEEVAVTRHRAQAEE